MDEEVVAIKSKWAGYKPKKGVTPPWNPFNPENRKKKITLRERKFMMLLSTTGSLQEAYRAVYKVTPNPDKRIENARVNSGASQVLARIRRKDPAYAASMTFEDITPDFVRKALLNLFSRSKEKGDMQIEARVIELMGKTQALFTDKIQTENKVKDVLDDIYKESDDDFPDKDERIGREDIEKKEQVEETLPAPTEA